MPFYNFFREFDKVSCLCSLYEVLLVKNLSLQHVYVNICLVQTLISIFLQQQCYWGGSGCLTFYTPGISLDSNP